MISDTDLFDANLWLALAADKHIHHLHAKAWFTSRGDRRCAFCRVTQFAFLRHLTNRAITLFILWFLAYSGMAYRKAVDTVYHRERELSDFLANAPVGIHWVAPDGRILRANQEVLDMLGYAREEYVGRNVIEFHVDRKVAENILAKLNADVPLKECAARLRHKDGSMRHVLISCNSYLEDGRFIHSRCFTQDITDRVRAEFAESEQRRSLALEDRERLSRDLHDHVIQAIYAIGMQLEACQRRLRSDSKETATQLTQAVGGLNAVIRDVRQYISGSEPQILSKRQLRAELAKLVKAIRATGTLRFRLKRDPLIVTRLTPQQAEHLLHIAREAMSNALQHSHAKHAELSLHGTGAGIRLEIRDDGVGFDPDAAGRDAGGLHNMQSRARQTGGRLEIRSSPGQGATISLHIPNENTIHGV